MTGLLNRKTRKTLPLRSSSVRAEIKGFTARTTAVLTYYNDNRTEIEGLFVLPLDHTATIVEFEAIIEDRYIFADVKDPSEVQQKNILFKTKNLQDGYFKVSVGKISPWVIAEIQVTVVCEISALILGDALRYTLPQTFSPKVVTSEELMQKKYHQTISVSTLGYCFNIEIEIDAPCLLYGVQSNTHPIQVDAPPLSQTGSKIVVSIPDDFEPNDEVFELLMFLCRPREPYIVIEEAKRTDEKMEEEDRNPINSIMNNPILMLSYSPDIPTLTNTLDITSRQSGEFILMVDCSIMENIENIRESCLLFLKSLPINCFFNVVSFSNEFSSLYQTSQTYTCATMDSAITFVMNLSFNLKSGSLYQPLKWLFDQDQLAHKPKQIFIVTKDPQNEDLSPSTWYKTPKKEALARCFIFHVGDDRNRHYLEMLATITRGKYMMVFEERIQRLMASCLLAAVQPVIIDVNVSWILPDAYDVIYTPEKLPSVFLGERLNLYAILASKENCPGEKPTESVNSVKEFWFEDTDLFEEDYKPPPLPINIREQRNSLKKDASKEETDECDSEVFLTEEEVRHLSHEMAFPKRSSIDRVQKWKVSKFPQNHDIESDFEGEEDGFNSEKEHSTYLTNPHTSVRKKGSLDGAESVGSSNSFGSNRSSNSHFHAFPGFPTRMSSCRSIEARSPHVPRLQEDVFSFQENTKLCSSKVNGSQVNISSDHSSDHHSSGHHSGGGLRKESTQTRPMARLTEALYSEKANTHLLDDSNEKTIELMLENLVTDKRQRLQMWLREQEEMTQCSWPITEHEKREYFEKNEWRDSGIGNRSSSDAHTSDMEEENYVKKKIYKSEEIIYHGGQSEKAIDPISCNNNKEKETIARSNSLKATTTTSNISQPTKTTKAKLSQKTSVSSTSSHFQKRKSKAKSMWNAIIEKVRSVGAIVTEKSGEATFKRSFDSGPEINERQHRELSRSVSNNFKSFKNTKLYDSADNFFSNENITSCDFVERQSEPPSVRPRSQGGYRQNYSIKNFPIIENSRTISTTSMFEIGKSEIGDVENLHLLPSHALIYLSGHCGEHAFKRLIPFQLEVESQEEGVSYGDTTIHQLAAKSIIHDLEMQMENDGMLEDHGKMYIKSLISEVSKAANVLSRYTTLVAMDDKCTDGEILSAVQYENSKISLKNQPTSSSFNDAMNSLTIRNNNVQDGMSSSATDVSSIYMRLLLLMTSDGSWRPSEKLAKILSITLQNLNESCPFKGYMRKEEKERVSSSSSKDCLFKEVWATSLALVWLQMNCDGHKDEWELVERKANYWLKKQNLPTGFKVDDLTRIAENTLKTLRNWMSQNTKTFWSKDNNKPFIK